MYTGVVYCYTNTFNNKKYIGKTVNEEERILRHKREAIGNKRNSYFYNAIRKYGWNCFTYTVLYRVYIHDKKKLDKKLLQLEVFMIKLFNTNKVGYNMTNGGEGCAGRIVTEEVKARFKESYRKENHPMFGKRSSHAKVVLKLDKSGKIITEYNSIRDAGTDNKVSPKNVSACCNLIKFSLKGFIYRFKENYNESVDLVKSFREGKVYNYRPADKERFKIEIESNSKKCTKCNRILPIINFRHSPKNRSTLLPECKECMLDYQREYNKKKKLISAIPK